MLSTRKMSKYAARSGVSFVSVTDHNTLTDTSRHSNLIPGEEWGQRKGHANFVSISSDIDPEEGYYNGKEPVEPHDFNSAAADARSQGAFITINHPFKADSWKWTESLELVDGLEIWNGKWGPENEMALDYWQDLLGEGKRILPVAGADFHVKVLFNIASPVMVIRGRPSAQETMRLIRGGNYAISLSPGSPAIFLESDGGIKFHVENYLSGLQLRVRKKNTRQIVENCPETGILEFDPGEEFIRAELWKNEMPLSFSVPVFS